jgi:hypothetical protein
MNSELPTGDPAERDDPEDWTRRYPNLDAALARTVRAPRLDARFDAAVWQRIEQLRHADQRDALVAPTALRRDLWLEALNWVAGAITAAACVVVLALRFGEPIDLGEQVLTTVVGTGAAAAAAAFALWQAGPLRRFAYEHF